MFCPQEGAEWATCGGGQGDAFATDADTNAEGEIVVVGHFNGGLSFGGVQLDGSGGFVSKLDEAGTVQWTTGLSGEGIEVWGVAAAADGGAVAVGGFRGTLAVGDTSVQAHATDAFVARLDADGAVRWLKAFGTSETETCEHHGTELECGFEARAHVVALDATGHAIVEISFGGNVDFGAGVLDADAGNLATVRIDPGGETTWATAHTGAYALGVAVGPSGEIAVVGGLGIGEGDGDGESELVRKLDGTTGELVWSLWEPGWNVGGDSVAFDPGGDILVGASDFGAAYVYKVDGALGTIDWKRTLASPTRTPQSFGVSAIGGDVVVAGTFEGSVSTAGTTLQSLGEYDIYGFRLGPDGSVVASVGYGHGGSENAFGGGFTSEGSPVAVGIVGSMFVDLFVAKLDL